MTLLELLIVLAVLAGLAAVAWPTLRRPLSDNQLREAANAVCSAIEDARQQAIVQRSPMIVRLESDSDRCWIGDWESMLRLVHDPANGTSNAIASQGAKEERENPPGLKPYRFTRDVEVEWVHWDLWPVPKPNREEREEQRTQLRQNQPQEPQAWHLPLLPNGQGRDATIRLRERDSGLTIDVRYHSSQGVTEVTK